MTKRILIAIGCNEYQHQQPLEGGENDAQNIYEALIDPEKGAYDSELSKLLLSPTLGELRAALITVFSDAPDVDTLTIFFAGHAGVVKGSLYLALVDTKANLFSATALSLSELLRVISEISPRQSNIIIDACQSGGLVDDLNSVLKAENFGATGTPGLTLLATATANQSALEDVTGGIGTRAILDCINGVVKVHDDGSTLDLIDIGRVISPLISKDENQTPVVWGLNLVGVSSFCKNPFSGGAFDMPTSFAGEISDNEVLQRIGPHLSSLWRTYLHLEEEWNAREFLHRLKVIIEELNGNPQHQAIVLERVYLAASQRAKRNPDKFVAVEVIAVCAVAALPIIRTHEALSEAVQLILQALRDAVYEALASLMDTLKEKPFCLIAGASADYFYLPIRVMRIMGWASYVLLSRTVDGEADQPPVELFAETLELLLGKYGSSLCAMSDVQAPYLAITMAGMSKVQLSEKAEELLGYLLFSLSECKGLVASTGLDGEEAFEYLYVRVTGDLKPGFGLVAQPSELIAVCIYLSSLLGLDDQFDFIASDLDHVSINAFLPHAYEQFGDDVMEDGVNISFQIGHDIWRCEDFRKAWPSAKVVSPPDNIIFDLGVIASLLFPNRTPWYVMPSLNSEAV